LIAEVIIDIKHLNINQTFDYFVNQKDQSIIKKGMRVYVPFGAQKRVGYVSKIKNKSSLAKREIIEVIDSFPIFNEELFKIVDYLLTNPQTIIAKAFETVISTDLLLDYEKIVKVLKPELIPKEIKNKFNRKGKWSLTNKDKTYNHLLKKLEVDNIIKIETVLKSRVKQKEEAYIVLNKFNYQGNPNQLELIEIVKNYGEIKKRDLIKETSASRVNTLLKHEVLKEIYKPITLDYLTDLNKDEIPKLNKDLNNIINNISQKNLSYLLTNDFKAKLNLLINLSKKIMEDKKQVLVLAPEIFLSKYYYEELIKYFDENIVFFNDSTKTHKQRYLIYETILNNDTGIIIGARSNIFTQVKNLGAIIILNSYDDSYISTEGIYYDTNEIALIRSKYHNVPIINLTNNLSLKEKYLIESNKKIPFFDLNKDLSKEINVVDLKEELLNGNTKMISTLLTNKINTSLEKNENVLLIMNQKGYAPFVMCRTCSYVPTAPNSDIPLNYVKSENILRSNLIKYEEKYSITCPKCGKNTLVPVGVGIERLYEEVKSLYKNERIVVITQDILSKKEVYDFIINLGDNDKTIILGTQMALKSILYNKVRTVSLILFEQWLKRPHYNGYLEAFYTLNNAYDVSKNNLIIQTYDSDNLLLKSINNKESFYQNELRKRRISKLPPYYDILQVMTEGDSYLKTYQHSFILKNLCLNYNLDVVGPTPSSMLVKNKRYRFLLVIKYQKELPETIINYIKKDSEFINFTTKEIIWY